MGRREDAVIVNTIVRQALVAVEEVMGANGLNAVLRLSNLGNFVNNLPPDNLEPGIQALEYARLNQAIEEFYGRGGRGMLKRIGKASSICNQRTTCAPRRSRSRAQALTPKATH